jgi:hypothetical protein
MVLGLLDNVRARFQTAPGTARLPGKYQISDFIGDQQGVDDATTSTVTLLHDQDTVTFVNPFESATAYFSWKKVTNTKVKVLWGTGPQKTEVAKGEKVLGPGETWTVTNKEGTSTVGGTGYSVNQDTYVTLTQVETEDGETALIAAGEPIFGPGGYWNPQNIIKRVRGRRMFVGPMSLQIFNHPQVGLTPKERADYMNRAKQGEISSPFQAVAVRASYSYDDTRKWKEDVQEKLRPY